MPHWGIALALGPNINLDVDPEREKAAYDEAIRALALAPNAPPAERAYVGALLKRYSNNPQADLKALAVRYKDAMRDLSRRYSNDLDAATLYAEALMDLHPWQLWSADGKPTEGTLEIVDLRFRVADLREHVEPRRRVLRRRHDSGIERFHEAEVERLLEHEPVAVEAAVRAARRRDLDIGAGARIERTRSRGIHRGD